MTILASQTEPRPTDRRMARALWWMFFGFILWSCTCWVGQTTLGGQRMGALLVCIGIYRLSDQAYAGRCGWRTSFVKVVVLMLVAFAPMSRTEAQPQYDWSEVSPVLLVFAVAGVGVLVLVLAAWPFLFADAMLQIADQRRLRGAARAWRIARVLYVLLWSAPVLIGGAVLLAIAVSRQENVHVEWETPWAIPITCALLLPWLWVLYALLRTIHELKAGLAPVPHE